jgi:hypothetical protein
MKTDQVSRRSASYRRRLFAAGVLSAVVALSYVGSAFAVDCPPNSLDVFNSDGDFDETTASEVSMCGCAIGYKPVEDGVECVPCANSGTMTLYGYEVTHLTDVGGFRRCGGIAPGYFGTAKADDTTDADPALSCTDVYTSATQDHVTSTTPRASETTTPNDCKTKPGYYLETVYDGSNDDSTVTAKVTANSYGAGGVALSATTDNSVNACPDHSYSEAGSVAIGDCKCGAGYKATAANTCETCPPGTSWTTAPSVGTSATFCEEILAGYYGTLGSGADASPTACPSGWTSAGLTSGGPTTIADCRKAASGITTDKTMYSKSGDSTNVYHCPTGTVNTAAPVAGTASFCSSIAAGYYGVYGNDADASPTACPENSDSAAGSTELADCECAANFYPSNNACVACATGTTREGTVSVTGTATCSTADSAGATAPIAVALAAAAAVPLLL